MKCFTCRRSAAASVFRSAAAVSLFSLLPATAGAAGFALEDGSARGNVIPGSLTAKGGTPSALYFNPAAITSLPGTQTEIGLTLIRPAADILTVDPYTGRENISYGDGRIWPLPHAYLTHQINDSLWFGFGMFTRFGLGAEFSSKWPGRYNSYKAEILSVDFNPNLAWRINDRLSLSAGISIRYFDIELAQRIDAAGAMGLRRYNDPSPSPYDVDQNLHGDDINAAIDLGLMYRLSDTVSFGAGYHSRIKFNVKGDAKWEKPATVNAVAPMYFNNTSFHAENYNPDKIMLALAWDATPDLTFSTGLTYTLWSLYDNLEIYLEDPMMPGKDKLESKKSWNDTFRVSLGVEYDFSESWKAYAGYTWDQSPLNSSKPDYLVPGDNRHLFGLGFAWTKDAWTVDLSYFYEIVEDYDVKARPQSGVFKGKFQDAYGHAAAVGVSRKF